VEASIAVGGAARRNGDWDTSARAYSQAAYIADTLGDRPGVLTVQVGIANTYMAKGNLPQAQVILDDVLVQARDQNLTEVQGYALHSRASLAQRKGDNAEGVKLAYEALSLTKNLAERDLVLEDIAAMFTGLGLHDAARDAHIILAATAQSTLARGSATVNLMELASLDGMREAFDSYARELAAEKLSPWIRAHYLLFVGEGFGRFDEFEAAEDALNEAVTFAQANEIHQVSFRGQNALTNLRSVSQFKPSFTPPPSWMPEEVETVVRGISELRKTAVAAT
jgi:tetratricopeptide (TPR) repeat protein